MEIVNQFGELFIGAVLGTIVSYLFPQLLDFIKNRKSKKIFKTWLSEWKPENDDPHYWTTEEVSIKRFFGKVILRNKNNSDGYEWKAKCELVENRYLIGTWESTKPEASSSGTVMLTKSTQGDFMFGQFTGPNDQMVLKSGDFVLGNDQEAILKAKRWIDAELNNKISLTNNKLNEQD